MENLKSILLISQFHQAFFHFWVFVLTIPFAGDIYYFLQFFGVKYLNLLRYSLNVMFLQGLSPVILPKMSSYSYSHIEVIVVIVQSPSVSNPETPWMQHHRPPCLSLSRRVCPSLCPLNRWCYPTISSSAALLLLHSVFPPSGYFPVTQLFVAVRWPKYWNFIFIFSPSSGLISFWIDRFDLLAIQGTLKNLFQNYNLKASILQHSAFSMLQLSYLYITTERPCILCCA